MSKLCFVFKGEDACAENPRFSGWLYIGCEPVRKVSEDSQNIQREDEKIPFFLLRLWQARQNDENGWRASLENPHTGEVRGFASLDLLWDYLCEQTQTAGKGRVSDEQKIDELSG